MYSCESTSWTYICLFLSLSFCPVCYLIWGRSFTLHFLDSIHVKYSSAVARCTFKKNLLSLCRFLIVQEHHRSPHDPCSFGLLIFSTLMLKAKALSCFQSLSLSELFLCVCIYPYLTSVCFVCMFLLR